MLLRAVLEEINLRSIANAKFWKYYAGLPSNIAQSANEAFQAWKRDPWSSVLQFKKTYAPGDVWSVRVGNTGYRALAFRRNASTWEWFWIGSHQDYDKLLSKR